MEDPLLTEHPGNGIRKSSPLVNNREARRRLARESRAYPAHLVEIPREEWPPSAPAGLERVLRSRRFLVQVYAPVRGARRLSVTRCALSIVCDGRFSDRITWDELQSLKREAGYGNCDAVEIYPADRDIVNAANMRHLWVLKGPLPFAWRKRGVGA